MKYIQERSWLLNILSLRFVDGFQYTYPNTQATNILNKGTLFSIKISDFYLLSLCIMLNHNSSRVLLVVVSCYS